MSCWKFELLNYVRSFGNNFWSATTIFNWSSNNEESSCKINDSNWKWVRNVNETKYSRMDQVNFFKGCVSQILLGLFLNTLPKYFTAVRTSSRTSYALCNQSLKRLSNSHRSAKVTVYQKLQKFIRSLVPRLDPKFQPSAL